MNVFDSLNNEDFFKPLTSRHHRIYYDAVRLLIERSKSLPVYYESTARDDLNIFLRNIKYLDSRSKERTPVVGIDASVDRSFGQMAVGTETAADDKVQADSGIYNDGSEDELSGETLSGASIISRFRECGWLRPRELGRNGEYIVEITTDCRRIMDFFHKLTERLDDGEMSNRIFSMYEICAAAFEEDNARRERPYANILLPLMENATGLKNELADLKENIAHIMKSVMEFQDLNSFGQFLIRDEMLERFFSEYFFIKNNGMIPTQLAFIRERVRRLRSDDMYDKMIEECMSRLEYGYDEARERIDNYFSLISYFLSDEYMDNMELIDRRINTYYRLANTRIALMTSEGVNMENAIHEFLMKLSSMEDAERSSVIKKVGKAVRINPHKYIGTRSFERQERYERDLSNIGLEQTDISDEELADATGKMFEQAPNKYSVKRVSAFIDGVMGSGDEWQLKGHQINERSEALMYAGVMAYQANDEFPYDVEVDEEETDTGLAYISDIKVRRRG